jgi:hypothetical protein
MNIFIKLLKINKEFLKLRKEKIRLRFGRYISESIPIKFLILAQICLFLALGHEKHLDSYIKIFGQASYQTFLVWIAGLFIGAYFSELNIYLKDAEANDWRAPDF